MKSHTNTLSSVLRTGRLVSLAFFPVMIVGVMKSNQTNPTEALAPNPPEGGSRDRPYLVVTGPTSLRFAEAPPPEAKAAPPPLPEPEDNLADLNQEAVAPEPVEPPPPPAPVAVAPPPPATPAVAPPPPPLVPDDTLRKVRPEEVLPYFEFPGLRGLGGSGNVAPPQPSAMVPPTIPPSSATYIQK